MFLTKKKYENLKKELRGQLKKDVESKVIWEQHQANELLNDVKRQVKWTFTEEQEKELRDVATRCLYDLMEHPPREFIEAVVQRINLVQLKDS